MTTPTVTEIFIALEPATRDDETARRLIPARIAEKSGCDLRRLADVIDLLIAVRLVDR